MCHAQLRGLVEDRGYPLFPEAGKNAATLSASQPPKKCTDVNKMYEHMDQVILFMDTQIKVFLADIIQNLELVRDEINKVIKEFYHRLDSGELILRENANKRQIYSRLESFEGDKISIELSLSFFRDCYMKIDADAMKLLGGRLSSMEQGPGPTMDTMLMKTLLLKVILKKRKKKKKRTKALMTIDLIFKGILNLTKLKRIAAAI
jgi:hypothetical protein